MFCSHKMTDLIWGMAAGIAVGAVAAACTCLCADPKKMKKVKCSASHLFEQAKRKVDNIL